MSIIRNTQRYMKPFMQRKLHAYDATRSIQREDFEHKMKFLMRKNRADPYPGQITD